MACSLFSVYCLAFFRRLQISVDKTHHMQTEPSSNDFFTLGIDPHSRELLRTSATWAKIIAIVGFISAGISILTSVISSVATSANVFASIGPIGGSLIMAAITVSLNLFLLRFA